jgi:hypothetical protein
MCYEERLFRSWTAKRARKHERDQPVTEVTERDRPKVEPIRTAPAAETKPRKEMERELEEIV